MQKAEGRDAIVAEARKWLGTPFRRRGRTRGRGVDCVGLPLCVMRDLGIADWTQEPWALVYPDQPMTDRVLEICQERLAEKTFESIEPGDILVFRAPTVACHAGIASCLDGFYAEDASNIAVIHAYSPAGKVVEHRIDEKWRRRLAGVFNPPGIE